MAIHRTGGVCQYIEPEGPFFVKANKLRDLCEGIIPQLNNFPTSPTIHTKEKRALQKLDELDNPTINTYQTVL